MPANPAAPASIGLVLKVEEVDPPERAGVDNRSQEQIIADFLAQVGR